MVSDLFIPRRDIIVPKMPSYVKLAMAFPIGAGAQLMDKSRYRSHGTISGATWATGAHGRCLDFDAAAKDYVEIAAAYDQLDFTSEKFSLVMRVYIESYPSHVLLVNRGEMNVDGWRVFILSNGEFFIETDQLGENQQTHSATGSIATATWYTLGCSRDGSASHVYIDGVVDDDHLESHVDPLTSARTLKIGINEPKTGFPLDGKIEFLRIFGGIALSASEHLAWHNALA